MKINELPCKITESQSLRELMGLRVCRVILDDINSDGELSCLVDKRIKDLGESAV